MTDPSSVDTARLVAEAAAALQVRQFDQAQRLLDTAFAAAPDDADALRLLGALQRMRGRSGDAIATLRRALQLRPDDALIHNSLGGALESLGDRDAAIAAFRRACELAPTLAQAWYNLGSALSEGSDLASAQAALERAIELAPGHVPSHRQLARALRIRGRMQDSADRYRMALALAPADSASWLGLAALKSMRFSAHDVAAMRRAYATAGERDRIRLGFALAKALEDSGGYAEAFALLREANARVRTTSPWSAAAFSAHVDAIHAAFTDFEPGPASARGAGTVFIVGMPRSGSTLIEQILAGHADVSGAGELNDLPALLAEESGRRGSSFPDWVASATPADWSRLGEAYLERTAVRRGARAVMTDKLPENWLHVGAIFALLPGARVVVCERDSVETGLSCFKQLFSRGRQPFSYDLADIGAYSRDCARLTRLWRERWPDRVRVQNYEALLADPEREPRALLAFCRLPFDPASLRFHETARDVRTASAGQVRQPLNRDTARAAGYGVALDPLRLALGVSRSVSEPR